MSSIDAAERVWEGGGRGNDWTDVANWTALGGVPLAGDSLHFPAGALTPSNNNDFPAGTSFNALTYAGAGYTAAGNEIGLTGGIVVSHGAGNTILNLPINVALNQTFTVSQAGANLFLNGAVELAGTRTILTFDGAGQTVVVGNISDSRVIIGDGTIRKNGTGTLYVLQNLTFGGPTIVNGGTLIMDGRMSNSAVTVNASATLRGTGKVGGLTVNSGGTVSPGQNSPDILDSLGDVALNAGSMFNVRLNGTSVGINYDQLRVQGSVTLGGTLNVTAGFVAAIGDTFTIIENDSTEDVVGTFAGLPERAILMVNGRPFRISYGARGLGGFGRDVNDVTLEAVPALAVWDGGGGLNKFWSEPLNWVGDVVPMPEDDVQFASAGSGTLTTVNDFPAGRVFGSMIFAGGRHSVEGNLAHLTSDIRFTQSNQVEVVMPISLAGGIRLTQPGILTIKGPLSLTANQIFWVDHTNALLQMDAPVDAGNHNLTIRNVPRRSSFTLAESPSVNISGDISGSGNFIKEGVGELLVYPLDFDLDLPVPTINVPVTAVNEGTFNNFRGRFLGKLVVNQGARLEAGNYNFGSGSEYADVDVLGGTFRPGYGPLVRGTLRMLDGATFEHRIIDQGANGVFSTFLSSGLTGVLELSNCNYNLTITPNTVIATRTSFWVTLGDTPNGTFNGLSEGAPLSIDGHAFTITYQGGVTLTVGGAVVWDGGGSGNVWTTAANWTLDMNPFPGNSLVFPANVSKLGMINAFDPGTRFRSLTFGGPSYLLVGNSFQLTEGIYNDVASGDTTITADFVATGNFTSRVSSASRLLLEGSVTRGTTGASWRKTGTGTLRFTGTTANSQSSINVEAGELELDKTSGVDAISANLQIGDGTNDVRVTLLSEHQIADSASVTILNRARLDLNGNDETIDRLQGDGTVSLEGRLIPGRSGRLTVSNGTFSGSIVGDGGLTKVGSTFSSLTLSGNNTFSGMTILSGGTLAVEGTQTASPIRLDGGILRGRGSVGTITGNLGGTLQPGSGGADFQVALHSPGITLNPSTTFRALLTSIDPGYENHKLQVNGAVNLGASVLSIDLSGNFRPTTNRSFVIIENDGSDPVVDTFAGLPEGAVFGGDGLPFRITYVGGTGNDVVITRVGAPASTLSFITGLSNGQMRVEGLGIGGVIYPIQAASNLNPVIFWTNVGNGTGDANGLFRFIDTSASNRPMRFYRAVSP